MRDKQIHETATRLIEGGREYYNGHWFRAVRVSSAFIPCDGCEMDSLCNDDIGDLCVELDCITGSRWLLKLADAKR